MLLNSNQIAKAFNSYPMAITRAIKAGKLTRDNNGLIDTEQAEQFFKRKPDLSVIAEQLENKALAEQYRQARTERLEAEAKLTALKLGLLKGDLVLKDDVEKAAEQMAQLILDRLNSIPARLSCSLEGKSKEEITTELTRELEQLLLPLKSNWLEYFKNAPQK